MCSVRAKIIESWWDAIRKCTYDQLDFCLNRFIESNIFSDLKAVPKLCCRSSCLSLLWDEGQINLQNKLYGGRGGKGCNGKILRSFLNWAKDFFSPHPFSYIVVSNIQLCNCESLWYRNTNLNISLDLDWKVMLRKLDSAVWLILYYSCELCIGESKIYSEDIYICPHPIKEKDRCTSFTTLPLPWIQRTKCVDLINRFQQNIYRSKVLKPIFKRWYIRFRKRSM